MSRWNFLVPMLIDMVVGGCSGGGVEPTVTSSLDVAAASDPGTACDSPESGVVHPVGELVAVVLKAAFVTTQCRCEFTTGTWGCSGARVCESTYDIGGPNPPSCQIVASDSPVIQGVRVSVNRPHCVVAVTIDPHQSDAANLSVRCDDEGAATAEVTLLTNTGTQVSAVTLTFTNGGLCPALAPDASLRDGAAADGAPDAGDEGDAADMNDAGSDGDSSI